MPKLETQINQIYFVSPEAKKTSIIMYEERLKEPLHLFMLLELANIKKKTEVNELKKISEIILQSFRANQKMPVSSLFEATLAQINQKLADAAHKGSKSWLGKFSALIALKSDTEIFISNSGQTAAWLKRKRDLTEVINPEKRGEHPLKMFTNFASGRIKEGDSMILTTNSLFNFVSLQLLTKMLAENTIEAAAGQVSQILKESAGTDDCFATFFLEFEKDGSLAAPELIINRMEEIAVPAAAAVKPTPAPAPVPELSGEPIYAPLPEDLKSGMDAPRFKLPNLDNIKRALTPRAFKLSWRRPSPPDTFSLDRFKKLTGSGKFFLICFLVFLAVFILNLTVLGSRSAARKNQEKIAVAATNVQDIMDQAESAVIYKNDDQAVKLLGDAKQQIEEIRKLNEKKANELAAKYDLLAERINRITNIPNPRLITELKHNPVFLTKAGTGFVFANKQSSTISTFTDSYKNLFLLNEVSNEITGLAHVPGSGNWLSGTNQIYRISSDQTEVDALASVRNGNLLGLKFLNPNRVYTADKTANQILRFPITSGRPGNPVSLLKTGADLQKLADFGLDADIYLLFPDAIKKFVNGNEQAFRIQRLSDPMTSATKIFVGNNLYVLEPGKRRLIVLSKTGVLQSQLVFPNAGTLTDFYVNETERRIQLIDGNKLVEITF